MNIYTYLSAMEKCRERIRVEYFSVKNHDYYLRLNRQYWKFRERLIHRIERLQLAERNYKECQGLMLAVDQTTDEVLNYKEQAESRLADAVQLHDEIIDPLAERIGRYEKALTKLSCKSNYTVSDYDPHTRTYEKFDPGEPYDINWEPVEDEREFTPWDFAFAVLEKERE